MRLSKRFAAWRRARREHELDETVERDRAIESLNETDPYQRSRALAGIPEPEDRPED